MSDGSEATVSSGQTAAGLLVDVAADSTDNVKPVTAQLQPAVDIDAATAIPEDTFTK